MSDLSMKWYTLRALSGKENQVKEYLEAEINLGKLHNVGQVLIPTEKIMVQQKNGKKVMKERPYLPGYVIVEAKLSNDVAHNLVNTPNVLDFLRDSMRNPLPLRQTEVNRILGIVDQPVVEDVQFEIGDAVRVVGEQFNGFAGIVQEVCNEKKTLKIDVKVFGRLTPIELSFSQVEKE